MKWILLLILPVLQGCLIGPEHEGKEHWAEKILPINLTERRATSQQANWGQYLYEKRMGIAGPKVFMEFGIMNLNIGRIIGRKSLTKTRLVTGVYLKITASI